MLTAQNDHSGETWLSIRLQGKVCGRKSGTGVCRVNSIWEPALPAARMETPSRAVAHTDPQPQTHTKTHTDTHTHTEREALANSVSRDEYSVINPGGAAA